MIKNRRMDENTKQTKENVAGLGKVVVSNAFSDVPESSDAPSTRVVARLPVQDDSPVSGMQQPRQDVWSFDQITPAALPVTATGRMTSMSQTVRRGLAIIGTRPIVLILSIILLVGSSLTGVLLVRHTTSPSSQVATNTTHASPQLPVVHSGGTPSSPHPTQTSPSSPPSSSPSPTSSPKPSPPPPPAPLPSLPPVAGKDTSYSLGVLVIKYFPLTSNGQNINIAVTGDVGDSYTSVRQHTIDVTNNLLVDLPKATQHLARTYGGDQPSLTYHVVATVEHTTAVPINSTIHPGYPTYPDYYGIMSSHNICNYVDNQGVHEVWLWAYQGPNKPGTTQPYLGIEESKMSGPHGDISNSYEWNDMPVCKHTYVVYTFNYGRGTAEAMHSWGHQIEAEMNAVNSSLFGLFQGPSHPQAQGVTGRCGSVHNPPNSRQEYDYANPTSQASDCDDWNPDSYGKLSQVSCALWGCSDISDSDNSQLNYFIWMWQHLPGRNNTKTYQGKQLRNWWDVHGNFDSVMSSSKRLTL